MFKSPPKPEKVKATPLFATRQTTTYAFHNQNNQGSNQNYVSMEEYLNSSVRKIMNDIGTVEKFNEIIGESSTYLALKRQKTQEEINETITEMKKLSDKIIGLQS